MAIPKEILAVKRPSSTVVKQRDDRYVVIKRTSRRKGNRVVPVDLGTVGEIINGTFVEQQIKSDSKKRVDIKDYGEVTLIMTPSNFNTMIEAVEYLIENDVVKKQETKIQTKMKVSHLRYTFYLVFKNEGKCVGRQLWLDFLGETFSQMQNNKESLSNHFSDKPADYDRFLKPKKKK